jgi:hypothetical protein
VLVVINTTPILARQPCLPQDHNPILSVDHLVAILVARPTTEAVVAIAAAPVRAPAMVVDQTKTQQ